MQIGLVRDQLQLTFVDDISLSGTVFPTVIVYIDLKTFYILADTLSRSNMLSHKLKIA